MKVIDHLYDEDLNKLTVFMENVLPDELEDILLVCFNFAKITEHPKTDDFEGIIFSDD